MLGTNNPGNGRLAFGLVDALIKHLLAQGMIKQSDVEALTAEVASRLELEHTITSEGALIALQSSRIGQ